MFADVVIGEIPNTEVTDISRVAPSRPPINNDTNHSIKTYSGSEPSPENALNFKAIAPILKL